MKTELHDKIAKIFAESPLASEREAQIRELMNLPEATEDDTQADLAAKIADTLYERLKPKPEANAPVFYPTMKDAAVPEPEPLEGWDQDLKDFARGFYDQLKEKRTDE